MNITSQFLKGVFLVLRTEASLNLFDIEACATDKMQESLSRN
jgi:hypothetical protein